MRRLAFINQKGGVGKTTSAVNVAAALVRGGRRVLLVDFDPQAHASLHLGVEVAAGEPSIYDVLLGAASLFETVRVVDASLSVVPAHTDLVAAELELAQRGEREQALARALQPLLSEYDYLVIDCAPSLGLLAVNALTAADEVIIPLQAHFLALQGLGKLLETVAAVRDAFNPALRVSGVALCMFDRGTKLAQEVLSDVGRFLAEAPPDAPWHGARLFQSAIRRNVKLAEAPSFGQTIYQYAPGSHGAEDYAALAAEIDAGAVSDPGRSADTSVVASGSLAADLVGAPAAAAATILAETVPSMIVSGANAASAQPLA